jgi:hypothetical protein
MSDHAASESNVSSDSPQAETPEQEQQRIAALEAEVARLRQQLSSAERDGLVTTRGDALELSEAEEALALNKKVGVKGVLVAIAVVALALGLIVGIYTALASGFDAFAEKAAEKIVGGKDDSPENAVGGGLAVDPSVPGLGKTQGKAKKGAAKPATKQPATKQPATKQPGATPKEKGATKGKAPIQLPGL